MKNLSYTTDPQNLGNIVILQENNYYPFGLQHGGYNKDVKEIDFDEYLHLTNEQLQNLNADELLSILPVIKNKYKYKYNGKEWQDELGLNFYDYGARNYDPALGRWMNVDPLAEEYFNHSSYNYVGNNPIIRNDPTGMVWEDPLKALSLMNILSQRINSLFSKINGWQNDIGLVNSNDNWSDDKKARKIERIKNKINDAQGMQENLEQSIDDIFTIGLDDRIFAFSSTSMGDGKHGVRIGADGKIYIEGDTNNLKIHEIRHIVQSLEVYNDLRFDSNNYLLNAGQTYPQISNNEVDGYKAGYAVDGIFSAGSVNHIDKIDVHRVGDITDKKGNLVYPAIKKYSDFLKLKEKQTNKK